jgi:hypothetical protein
MVWVNVKAAVRMAKIKRIMTRTFLLMSITDTSQSRNKNLRINFYKERTLYKIYDKGKINL